MLDEKEPYLHIDHVTKRFEIETGSVVALNDNSGTVRRDTHCWCKRMRKSTLLKLIVGLSTCTEGKLCAGYTLTGLLSRGWFFRNHGFPETVEQNIAYGIPSSIL